jgi:hypothetical protein
MTEQQVQNAIAFLGRVDLKGQEAPALLEVIQELNKMLEPATLEPELLDSDD